MNVIRRVLRVVCPMIMMVLALVACASGSGDDRKAGHAGYEHGASGYDVANNDGLNVDSQIDNGLNDDNQDDDGQNDIGLTGDVAGDSDSMAVDKLADDGDGLASDGVASGEAVDNPEAGVSPVARAQTLPNIFSKDEEKNFTRAAQANRAFGFKWFDAVLQEQGEENTVISPYSASMALSMLMRGAEDETYDQIANALLIAGIKEVDNMREQALLMRHLMSREDVTLTSANSIWHHERLTAADDYKEQISQYYGAEIAAVNFTNSETPLRINNWVSEQTKGKIEQIVPDKISEDTFMYLINALYLQAEWRDPFQAERTTEQPFELPSGEIVQVPMMNQEEVLPAYDGDAVRAVRLGLGQSSKLSMTLILPHEGKSWPEVRREIEGDWKDAFTNYTVNVTLPKFKIEQELSLNESFQVLGMEAMFNKQEAQLGRMAGWDVAAGPNLYVDEALQKTYLEIDEKGLEAAAVTSIAVMITSGMMDPPEPMTLVFDRPFYFLIEDVESGAVLFIGAINDPHGE